MGECKAGCFHLLTFLPESSANTPAARHHSPKLVQGGRRGARPMPWPPSWPRPGTGDSQDAGPLPRRHWADAHALCPLPSPFWGLGQWFGYPPLVGWGEQGQKPTQGPFCVTGPAHEMRHERRTRVAWMGLLRPGGRGAAYGAGEDPGEEKLSGLSQAGAELGVRGMGSGTKDG